jgi:Fe-S cluster biogenesis protein NfuA
VFEVLEYQDNVLSVSYLGACGGCPSSMSATLQAIIHILRTEYNDQIEVVAI